MKYKDAKKTDFVAELIESGKCLFQTRSFLAVRNLFPYEKNEGDLPDHLLIFSKENVQEFHELSRSSRHELSEILAKLSKMYFNLGYEFAMLINNKTAKTIDRWHLHIINHTDFKKDLGERPKLDLCVHNDLFLKIKEKEWI